MNSEKQSQLIDPSRLSRHAMSKYLHHYSLTRKTQLALTPSHYFLKLGWDRIISYDKVLFLTSDVFFDGDLANDQLSLTYFPRYDSIIKVANLTGYTLMDNEGRKLNPLNVWNTTRVWPAFGKTGSAREIILKSDPTNSNVSITPYAINILPNGGSVELWHQDDVDNYKPDLAELIALGIVGIFNNLEGQLVFSNEGYSAQVRTHSIAVTARKNNSNLNITLSVALKNLDCQPEIKFRVCLWRDSQTQSVRSLLPSLSDQILLHSFPAGLTPEEALIADFKSQGPNYQLVVRIIKSLMQKILLVDSGFFDYHKQRFILS